VLLLACCVVFFASCTQRKPTNTQRESTKTLEDYMAEAESYKEDAWYYAEKASAYRLFVEEELSPALLILDDAKYSPHSYIESDSYMSVDEAISTLFCYIGGLEPEYITIEDAKEAYSVIDGYLDFTHSELKRLKEQVEDNFGN